jgi:serine protease AprX
VLDELQLDRWLYGTGPAQRHTQDSPILPDVWYAYALPPGKVPGDLPQEPSLIAPPADGGAEPAPEARPAWEADLLLRPRAGSSPGALAVALGERLERPRAETRLAFNDNYVVCRLTFEELLCDALPLTRYWQSSFWPQRRGSLGDLVEEQRHKFIAALEPTSPRLQGRRLVREGEIPGDVVWLVTLVGRVVWEHRGGFEQPTPPTAEQIVDAAVGVLGRSQIGPGEESQATPLWAISRNRPVTTAVWRSRMACKADAATTLFGLSCRDLCWAVIDSGIDARHPAFAARTADAPVETTGIDPLQSGRSRIRRTWDFAAIRDVLAGLPTADDAGALEIPDPAADQELQVADWVRRGRAVDWDEIAGKLEIRHDESYRRPEDDHGTHVAGILAGDWRMDDEPTSGHHPVQGMCPDIELYDLRAFDAAGGSDEFQVLSAMQFVRHLNAHADAPVIQGVNLSFSLRHEVDKYAAGATPVCEEAHRLVGSGVVVVAAAGNDGRGGYYVRGRSVDGYRSVSITDPGNAEKVITVGATHRDQPHTYGVSYFSSRGPTGDGRAKPDLVAPGEKISSPVPNGEIGSKDGTSQAAPHVSGACALLMSRHPELIGKPDRIKQILIDSCTDLGREHAFQGAGVVDVLRAIQAV